LPIKIEDMEQIVFWQYMQNVDSKKEGASKSRAAVHGRDKSRTSVGS